MQREFRQRVIFSAAVCAAAICGLSILWYGRMILLLLFAGIVGAQLLSIPTGWIQTRLGVRRGLALCIVLFGVSALLAGLAMLRGRALLLQITALQIDIPQATQAIVGQLNDQPWGRWLTAHIVDSARTTDGFSLAVAGLRSLMAVTTMALAALIGVLFTSLFLAVEPNFYIRGIRRLTPLPYRGVVSRCLESARVSLESWLVAKLLSMVVIGLMVALGLWALQVPLPGTLGFIAGLLTLIPNVGPVVSVIPAGLLAFAISPGRGVLTVLLFGLVHFLESNVVTPLAERNIVLLPPALTLAVQLLLASFTGIVGIAMAAPMTAAALGVLDVLLPPGDETAHNSPSRRSFIQRNWTERSTFRTDRPGSRTSALDTSR